MIVYTGFTVLKSFLGIRVFTQSSIMYSKTGVILPLSEGQKIVFQDQLSLNAGQKYCRMLQGEHSAILSTFIKLPFVIKFFVLSIFEWLFYTVFTVSVSLEYVYITCIFSYMNRRVYDHFFTISNSSENV